MKKTAFIGMLVLLLVMLAACGNSGGDKEATGTGEQTPATSTKTETNETASDTRSITYLGQEYTIPVNAEKIIITGAMEAMEDALVLDVHPAGAITVGGEFPERFAAITDQAQSIGEKAEPNFETILSLQPDVILGTTKFKPEVVEQLKKIAPLIQVSHIASDWKDNLNLMAELTGKQDQAKQIIEDYEAQVETAKSQLGDTLNDKEVVAIRIRGGEMYIYPANVFVNPVLYEDLGLTPPAEVLAAEAQEMISVEQFAEMNPDYVFIQFEEQSNKDNPAALEDLQNNPIIQKTTAFKDEHVFINVIDPLSEGGPAWSRTNFLTAAVEQLTK
ncbi:ABC transporter substrate-binding protein [Paenibacillus gallinarum]|uniref:ABC transporter substrate-binding protein n=1 Tax=Paenibacillus gallinarum TaxID=2762232 RepID=A0ABR8T2I9_9BACL|nr:ABC transporter substrate-binding protein [Paenibacillus gallinarum]MBD7969962.1 ABC transporter substrate-binding protein [Paenibacillus gallinarum]